MDAIYVSEYLCCCLVNSTHPILLSTFSLWSSDPMGAIRLSWHRRPETTMDINYGNWPFRKWWPSPLTRQKTIKKKPKEQNSNSRRSFTLVSLRSFQMQNSKEGCGGWASLSTAPTITRWNDWDGKADDIAVLVVYFQTGGKAGLLNSYAGRSHTQEKNKGSSWPRT